MEKSTLKRNFTVCRFALILFEVVIRYRNEQSKCRVLGSTGTKVQINLQITIRSIGLFHLVVLFARLNAQGNGQYLHGSTTVLSRQYSSTYMEVLQLGAVQFEIYAVVAKEKECSSWGGALTSSDRSPRRDGCKLGYIGVAYLVCKASRGCVRLLHG